MSGPQIGSQWRIDEYFSAVNDNGTRNSLTSSIHPCKPALSASLSAGAPVHRERGSFELPDFPRAANNRWAWQSPGGWEPRSVGPAANIAAAMRGHPTLRSRPNSGVGKPFAATPNVQPGMPMDAGARKPWALRTLDEETQQDEKLSRVLYELNSESCRDFGVKTTQARLTHQNPGDPRTT